MSDRFGGLDPHDDEFDSVVAFVEFRVEDDAEWFDHRHIQCLNYRLNKPAHVLRMELENWGLEFRRREKEHKVRGFTTSSHDRWYGPGSCKTHGGSGWSQIMGLAGQEG